MIFGRHLKPITELGARRQHGDRLRYLAGCRCLPCRAANSRYSCERQAAVRRGEGNPIVSATRARRHIRKLSRRGVGMWAVSYASGIGKTTICHIRTGRKKRIRKHTETAILAVDEAAIADRALVPARRTHYLIRRLRREGFTLRELARRLGLRSNGPQFGKQFVTARNALKVEKLFRGVME